MPDHPRTQNPSDEAATKPHQQRRVGMVLTTMGFGGVPEVVFQLMRNLPRDRYATSLCVLKREADADNVCDQRRDRFAELGFDVHYAADSSRPSPRSRSGSRTRSSMCCTRIRTAPT